MALTCSTSLSDRKVGTCCYEELVQLLDVARVRDDDLLISVGDVVDRGLRPLEVIELFRARARSLVLTGNHERKHVREVFSYAQQITRLQLGARYAECVAWMKWTTMSQTETSALLSDPPDDAKYYRTVAYRLTGSVRERIAAFSNISSR